MHVLPLCIFTMAVFHSSPSCKWVSIQIVNISVFRIIEWFDLEGMFQIIYFQTPAIGKETSHQVPQSPGSKTSNSIPYKAL